jgi:hypothetical protein
MFGRAMVSRTRTVIRPLYNRGRVHGPSSIYIRIGGVQHGARYSVNSEVGSLRQDRGLDISLWRVSLHSNLVRQLLNKGRSDVRHAPDKTPRDFPKALGSGLSNSGHPNSKSRIFGARVLAATEIGRNLG